MAILSIYHTLFACILFCEWVRKNEFYELEKRKLHEHFWYKFSKPNNLQPGDKVHYIIKHVWSLGYYILGINNTHYIIILIEPFLIDDMPRATRSVSDA